MARHGDVGSAHRPQPTAVRAECSPYTRMEAVRHAGLAADAMEPGGDDRIHRVGKSRGEMVLDLMVEPADQPAEGVTEDRHRRGDVDRRAELVGEEVAAASRRQLVVELGDVDAVCELERHGQHEPDQPRAHQVEARALPTTGSSGAGSRPPSLGAGTCRRGSWRRPSVPAWCAAPGHRCAPRRGSGSRRTPGSSSRRTRTGTTGTRAATGATDATAASAPSGRTGPARCRCRPLRRWGCRGGACCA